MCNDQASVAPAMLLPIILLTYSLNFLISHSLPNQYCNEKCGDLEIPFPFHLNSSCASLTAASGAFLLSCTNATALYLSLGPAKHRVLEFFPDGGGLLLDLPSRKYSDLNSFGGMDKENFGISDENVVGLYDCEDSSVCRAECEGAVSCLPGSQRPVCCYPLSDHGVWRLGDGFSVFSEFGCRGFSSWAVVGGGVAVKRGVKVEWAVPGGNSSSTVCSSDSRVVNATAVQGGVRCLCREGFVGDGFAMGNGCTKSCIKDRREVYGSECNKQQQNNDKTLIVIGGVLSSAFILASFAALFWLLKQPAKPGEFDTNNFHPNISFRKAFSAQLFTYRDLDEATRGFRGSQRLAQGTVQYSGALSDGSHVLIHEMKCKNEPDLARVLSQIEVLSSVPHQNLARVLGCCVDTPHAPLVVYEHPLRGSLEENLPGLGWPERLNAVVETANIMAFLHHEVSPPIFHGDLRPGSIFLDENLSAKISASDLLDSMLKAVACGSSFQRNDVYDMGMLLVEVIVGSNRTTMDLRTLGLSKIRNGKLEEIVDPVLCYHGLSSCWREQIERVADLASRCLLFGGDGKIGMADVSSELGHIAKQRGLALEETFSNSSLLQMISMSPDSIYLH